MIQFNISHNFSSTAAGRPKVVSKPKMAKKAKADSGSDYEEGEEEEEGEGKKPRGNKGKAAMPKGEDEDGGWRTKTKTIALEIS